MDVLALALFGVMLFPKADSFVDDVTIKVFLAFKTRAENPVTAILADTYIDLDQCHSGKRRLIVCFLPALFVWLIARFEERVLGIKCPVESVKQQGLEIKGANEWAQCLAGLTQKKIQWQPVWQQRTRLVYQCSKKVNVPFIGTKGCINYNPVLAQRQFGYPIAGAPISVVLEPLLVLYEEGSSIEILPELRRAWNKMVIQGKDTRPWTMNSEISYERWLMERVWMVKLPFKLCVPEVPKEGLEQEQESVESREVKQLKQEIDELKRENVRLTSKLFDLRHSYDSLVKDQEKIVKKQKERKGRTPISNKT